MNVKANHVWNEIQMKCILEYAYPTICRMLTVLPSPEEYPLYLLLIGYAFEQMTSNC